MHSAFHQQLPCCNQCFHKAVLCQNSPHRLEKLCAGIRSDKLRCRATLTKPSRPTAHPSPAHVTQRSSPDAVRGHATTFESLKLHPHDSASNVKLDLVVAGGGPSGIAVAERVSAAGYKVCVVDPAPLAHWPNNYGVWVDEFAAMGLDDCLEIIWPQAKVHLDSGEQNERFELSSPFLVDIQCGAWQWCDAECNGWHVQVSIQTLWPCGQDQAENQASAEMRPAWCAKEEICM